MENASDDFPQQKNLENILPNFAGSSPPISPKTSPTSLWKSLVLSNDICAATDRDRKTMSPRREVPTAWQAIVVRNLVVLQPGEDIAFV